jgi:cobalt-zinc-cadmium efflux system outer membrane protein
LAKPSKADFERTQRSRFFKTSRSSIWTGFTLMRLTIPALRNGILKFSSHGLLFTSLLLSPASLAAQETASKSNPGQVAKQLRYDDEPALNEAQQPLEIQPTSRASARVIQEPASVAPVVTTFEVVPETQPIVPPVVSPEPSSLNSVSGQESSTGMSAGWNLADLESLAFANNPSISRAAARVEAARGNQLQVGLRPNPIVGYEGQQLGSGGRAEQQGIGLSQEIVRGGKLQLNRAVATQEVVRAEQELAIEQLRVQTDVRIAFYNVLLAQERLALANKLVELSQQGATAVDTLLRIKEANRADVLQAQLEVENAAIVVQAAENRLAAAWSELASVVGDANLVRSQLTGDSFAAPQDFSWEQVLGTLRAASPEVAAALAEVCRARFALERAQVEPIPNVTIQGLVNVIDNGINGDPDGGLAVSIPLPVNNRNQGAIRQTRNELLAAEKAVEQLELALQNRLATVFERYSNARFQVDRYRSNILPAAEETLAVARKLYEAGESNYLALLTAQRSYFQVNLSYLESVLALRTAESEIDGFLLSGSLSSGR